jgi:hypothetical protein
LGINSFRISLSDLIICTEFAELTSCFQYFVRATIPSEQGDKMTLAKYSDIERLGEIAETAHDRPPEVLLMLTVYIDEAEQESLEHVVVGGFVGTCEQWQAFAP